MKNVKELKNFQKWKADDVHLLLGIQPHTKPTPQLLQWVNYQHDASAPTFLETLRTQLFLRANEWNEEELIFLFISPLLMSIGFIGKSYQVFLNRKIAIQIGEQKVEGRPDYIVASGTYEPEKPYFFLHEYKRFKGTEADPLGQLLISMVAAQLYNKDGLPIYGCFVVGRYWSFVVLEDKGYAVSRGYDATDEHELHTIWNILHHTKIIIEDRVNTKALQEPPPKPLILSNPDIHVG
jgi:hypothetical protein